MTEKKLTKEAEEALQKALNLGGLVKDWGGFEKLIADLNLTGNVTVEHDVRLVGRSGAPRQIDVLIRHQEGLIEHLVIIDCKHWKERVGRSEVDALATSVRELNASRGVLFSVLGFESGAITQAKAEGIDLFTIRELTDKEWGLPGRHIDFFLTCATKAVSNVSFPDAIAFGFGPSASLKLEIELGGSSAKTPIEPRAGTSAVDLESLLEAIVQHAASSLWIPQVLFNGANGTRSFWKHSEITFHQPIIVPRPGAKVTIPKIVFDIGVRLSQLRMKFDRGANYAFVLAVEDRVRGITRTAARTVGSGVTALTPIWTEEPAADRGPILQNGSIITVWLKPFFDFNELAGLQNGEMRDEIQNN